MKNKVFSRILLAIGLLAQFHKVCTLELGLQSGELKLFEREELACRSRCLKECQLADALVSCDECQKGCVADGMEAKERTDKLCDCDHAFTTDFSQRFCRASRLCAESGSSNENRFIKRANFGTIDQ